MNWLDPKNWYWTAGTAGWAVHSLCMIVIASAAMVIARNSRGRRP